jgi:hypothetical protein
MQLRAAAPAGEQGRFASVVGVKTDAGSEQLQYDLLTDVLTIQCSSLLLGLLHGFRQVASQCV